MSASFSRRRVAPAPPAVDGTTTGRIGDAWTLTHWMISSFLYSYRRATTRSSRRYCAALLVLSIVEAPLLVLINAILLSPASRTQFFFSAERDAVLSITRKSRNRWSIANHLTARPGTGAGKEFRAVLVPPLLEYADRHQISISATAATPELGLQYADEIADLRDTGRARPRGRQLLREPAGARASDA